MEYLKATLEEGWNKKRLGIEGLGKRLFEHAGDSWWVVTGGEWIRGKRLDSYFWRRSDSGFGGDWVWRMSVEATQLHYVGQFTQQETQVWAGKVKGVKY